MPYHYNNYPSVYQSYRRNDYGQQNPDRAFSARSTTIHNGTRATNARQLSGTRDITSTRTISTRGQSSSSSTVIFQTFVVQGLLEYDVAVYLIIGAAIGSVTPNLLASLTANRNGKRSAILNLLFNLVRAAIMILLINITPLLSWIQNTTSDPGRLVANTHTIFAIIAVVCIFPIPDYSISLTWRRFFCKARLLPRNSCRNPHWSAPCRIDSKTCFDSSSAQYT